MEEAGQEAVRKKKPRVKIVVIVIVAVLAVCAGAVAVFGETFVKRMYPQAYLASSVLKTFGGVPQAPDLFFIRDVFTGSWKHDFQLGVTEIDVGDADIDGDVLALSTLLKLFLTSETDIKGKRSMNTVNVQMGASSLLEVGLFISESDIALRVPQAFDYFVRFNPRTFVADWDDSSAGTLLPAGDYINQIDFNESYRLFLDTFFPDGSQGVDMDFTGMLEGAVYQYAGAEQTQISDETVKADVFEVTLAKESINAGITGNLQIRSDVTVVFYVVKGAAVRVEFAADPIFNGAPSDVSGSARFVGAEKKSDTVDFDLSMGFTPPPAYWRYYADVKGTWKGISKGSAEYDIDANVSMPDGTFVDSKAKGRYKIEGESRKFDLEIDRMDVSVRGGAVAEASLNARYSLQPGGTPSYDTNGSREIYDINLLDILQMYGRLMDSPIGELVEPYLQFGF